MRQFEVGKKYLFYMSRNDKKPIGSIEILKRTPKFITYHDDFFERTKKQKVDIKDNQEYLFAFYIGVFANDEIKEA